MALPTSDTAMILDQAVQGAVQFHCLLHPPLDVFRFGDVTAVLRLVSQQACGVPADNRFALFPGEKATMIENQIQGLSIGAKAQNARNITSPQDLVATDFFNSPLHGSLSARIGIPFAGELTGQGRHLYSITRQHLRASRESCDVDSLREILTAKCERRRHQTHAALGHPVEPGVFDLGDQAMTTQLSNQA